MNKEKINILAISPGNTGGVAFHRVLVPINYLIHNNNDFNIVCAPDEAIVLDSPNLYNIDIVHFHANITYNKPLMDKLYDMQKKGCKLIMDMDDYPIIPKDNPAYDGYMSKLHKPILATIKRVDVLTTTTKLFASELRKVFKKKIMVLPNVIDSEVNQFKIINKPANRIRIGLIGGASHFADYSILEGLVEQLGDDINRVQFVVCGFDITNYEKYPELNKWNDIERIFTNNYKSISDEYREYLFRYDKVDYPDIINQPYRRIYTKDIFSYGEMYNDIDILLAPLQNTKFNTMKSELKVVEAANFGKVIIASEVGQYKEVITNGYNGLLVPPQYNNTGWAKAIKLLINNASVYYTLQENLYKLGQNKYNIAKWNKKRIEFYKSMVK